MIFEHTVPLLAAAAQSLPSLEGWQWVVIIVAGIAAIAGILIESIKLILPVALFVIGLVLLAKPAWQIVGVGMFGVGVLLLYLQYRK